MIATLQSDEVQSTKTIRVYVDDELAGVAEPIANANANADTNANALYYLTIQSDQAGKPLRFETEDGTPSCCHGITFTFRPLVIDNWKIWRAVILWIIGLSLFTWIVIVKHWDVIWPFIIGLF
jgi:hypothetical protein